MRPPEHRAVSDHMELHLFNRVAEQIAKRDRRLLAAYAKHWLELTEKAAAEEKEKE